MINLAMLTQWITQIITVLILASIINLLVPETMLKKYIQLVVGLIMILIFLKPILFIFDMDLEKALEVSTYQLSQSNKNNQNVESLINFQKKEIQASQRAYIEEEMAVQLKKVASDTLLNKHNMEITNMSFLFKDEKDLSYEALEEVIVYVQEMDNEEGAVRRVNKIIINTNEVMPEKDHAFEEEISTLLADIWEIDGQIITVYWEGGNA